jgi:hypothetical protein
MTLLKRLQDPKFMENLRHYNEVAGHHSPGSGKITYNKIVGKRGFSVFTPIITSIVPLDIVNDPNKCHLLPSIARVLKGKIKNIYPQYFFLNATPDEYMDYEDEEDQESMDELIEKVDDLPIKTPLIGITVQKSEAMGSAHASAFIVWRVNDTKYKFAFYDPLSYKKKNGVYDYAEKAYVKSRFSQNIEFINLHEYCFHKTPEEYHCSQYVMNAEYCYIYSLYFLHKWIEFGAKLHRATFRKTIKSTYIVSPEKLTRADNKESMIYRVIMMAFVCETFLKYLGGLTKTAKKYILDSEKSIKRVKEYLEEFKELYGFSLV